MSEVLLLLKLRRRSGVLAAAVAAVHKAGLTFKSQQPRELDGAPALLLAAESDAVPDHASVCKFMTAVSGVDSVVEIRVDGSLLLPVEADADSVFDEGRTPSEPDPATASDDSPWSLGDDAPLSESSYHPSSEPEPPQPESIKAGGLGFEAARHAAPEFEPPVSAAASPVVGLSPGTRPDQTPAEPTPVDSALIETPVVEPEPEPQVAAIATPVEEQGEASGREMTRAMKRRWRRYR